jgi:hypothetical protein
MATDGPDPEPCDPDILKNGKPVFMTHSIPSNAMEGWVKMVAEKSGQKVDWHFVGGRAVVLTTGDVGVVAATIVTLLPEHDALYKKAMRKLGAEYENEAPPRGWM